MPHSCAWVMMTPLLIAVIILALLFDFINGFHDAANSIATIVTTKVLQPFQAVLWAAVFNFLAYFIIKDHKVAGTIAKLVNDNFVTLHVILAGVSAAIIWNLITWWFGIPSSSSHALIGGFSGAGMMNAHFLAQTPWAAIDTHNIMIIVVYIVVAPLIGLGVAYFILSVIKSINHERLSRQAQRLFKTAQLVSSAALSFAHGGNDAQKVMGIIYAALIAAHVLDAQSAMPNWIPLSCYTAIALGTMSGGWRIVKTVGSKITHLTPVKGVCVETAGALTLFVTQWFGIPVSTTHTVAGAVVGVGLTDTRIIVHWKVVAKLFQAWVITIPVTALFAAGLYTIIHAFV